VLPQPFSKKVPSRLNCCWRLRLHPACRPPSIGILHVDSHDQVMSAEGTFIRRCRPSFELTAAVVEGKRILPTVGTEPVGRTCAGHEQKRFQRCGRNFSDPSGCLCIASDMPMSRATDVFLHHVHGGNLKTTHAMTAGCQPTDRSVRADDAASQHTGRLMHVPNHQAIRFSKEALAAHVNSHPSRGTRCEAVLCHP
jgi:hypothetical protein